MMKPDALEKGLEKEIINRIKKTGLKIIKMEKRLLSKNYCDIKSLC